MPYDLRHTICISSQVGCALGCRFCVTGAHGFRRQLSASEILSQLKLAWTLSQPSHRPNVVLMGMGEPLLNPENVIHALRLMTAEWGMDLSKRKVTVSTAGVVPEMEALGRTGLGVQLSVSLNATENETRSRLMPVNRRFPIERLMAACRDYPLAPGRRITFEYVLIDGVNDTEADARRLVRLLRGIRHKVNLIPVNRAEHYAGSAPGESRVLAFQRILIDANVSAFIRESKGSDIEAACGQLWGGGSD